jgi:hypothetical protein
MLIFNLVINLLNVFNIFEDKNYFSLFAALTYFFGMVIDFFALYVLSKTLKVFKEKEIKIDFFAVISLTFAEIIFQISGVSQFLIDWEFANLFFLIGNVLFLGAIFLILINCIIHGNYIYMIPNPIQAILVYTKGGNLLYNRQFDPTNQKVFNSSETMFSGALSAFSSIFKEMLGTDVDFNYIDARAYEFYFEHLPENLGNFVVITKKANRILQKSMKTLVDNLPSELQKEIIKNTGAVLMEEFDILVQKYFPYLKIH